MNGPLAIFRQPRWHSSCSANFSILFLSLSGARAFGVIDARTIHLRDATFPRFYPIAPPPPHPPSPRATPSVYLFTAHRSALRKEGPRMGNEGVIDGIRVTQSTPTASSPHNEYTDRNEFLGPVNRQSLNWYWYTEAVKNVIKPRRHRQRPFYIPPPKLPRHHPRTFRRKLVNYWRILREIRASIYFYSRFRVTLLRNVCSRM